MQLTEYFLKAKKAGIKNIVRFMIKELGHSIDLVIKSLLSVALPIKSNYIVMESEGDYTDNIRAFSDYMVDKKYTDEYKLIWIVHNPSKYPKLKNVIFVSRFHFANIKFDYYCAVSKFFLFSHPYWLKSRRKGQIIINTTHSVAQLKAPTAEQKDIIFDYLLVCSPYCGSIKMKAFTVDTEHMLNIGMPRIDLLYKNNEFVKRLIPKYKGQKIVLSMETFRQSHFGSDSKTVDAYAINVVKSKEMIMQLDDFLNEKNIILVNKIHHLQDLSYIKTVNLKNIIYLTDAFLNDNDILTNQLLSIADALITDYSSVFYEFLLMDRPIGFLIGDMETYNRGFITDNPLDEMPGYKIFNFEMLIEFINSVYEGKDGFSKERKQIKNKSFSYFDDRNCERLYNWINNARRK